MKYTDNTVINFGKYEGFKLANIPASYLIFLYESKKADSDLREYIVDNLDALQFEMKQEKKVSNAFPTDHENY